jgi:hypothetical protein
VCSHDSPCVAINTILDCFSTIITIDDTCLLLFSFFIAAAEVEPHSHFVMTLPVHSETSSPLSEDRTTNNDVVERPGKKGQRTDDNSIIEPYSAHFFVPYSDNIFDATTSKSSDFISFDSNKRCWLEKTAGKHDIALSIFHESLQCFSVFFWIHDCYIYDHKNCGCLFLLVRILHVY